MPYIIKTEINGIQDFIFNIKTKGAAKALKARSYLIDAACELTGRNLLDTFKNSVSIYTGGGNVYLEVPDVEYNEPVFQSLLKKISEQLLPYNMQLTGCAVHFADLSKFGDVMETVNKRLGQEKLRFGKQHAGLFQPGISIKKDQEVFQIFSGRYARLGGIEIQKRALTDDSGIEVMNSDAICIGNWKLQLTDNGSRELLPLPLWTKEILQTYRKKRPDNSGEFCYEPDQDPLNSIISFECLAEFAKFRTGTNKIAVLKLDVDNLGSLFQLLNNRHSNSALSKALIQFFKKDLVELLDDYFLSMHQNEKGASEKRFGVVSGEKKEIPAFITETAKHRFRDNIYTVYAGGDDCFFIGAWDALAEFAIALQQKFSVFEIEQRKKMGLPPNRPMTISAAYMIVDPHYPVVRFAELIETALKEAKYIGKQEEETLLKEGKLDAAGKALKNKISFMGHVFNWQQFSELISVKNNFLQMALEFDTPSAFYQRIINAFTHTNNTDWQHSKPSKPFNPAILWRFKYSFRDVRHKDYFNAFFYDTFFSERQGYYKKYVWDDFKPGKELSAILPVAARWTEFLTRK